MSSLAAQRYAGTIPTMLGSAAPAQSGSTAQGTAGGTATYVRSTATSFGFGGYSVAGLGAATTNGTSSMTMAVYANVSVEIVEDHDYDPELVKRLLKLDTESPEAVFNDDRKMMEWLDRD